MTPEQISALVAQTVASALAQANTAQSPTPASQPTATATLPQPNAQARVAQHLLAKQEQAQDGETVNQAAAQVAAQQKLTGPTITKPAVVTPTGNMLRGHDGGPAVPLACFPQFLTLHWSDGTASAPIPFGQPKASQLSSDGRKGGKPGVYASGKVQHPLFTVDGKLGQFQVGCNFTRVHKNGSTDE